MNWSAPRQIRFCACTKMSMNRGDFRSLYQGLLIFHAPCTKKTLGTRLERHKYCPPGPDSWCSYRRDGTGDGLKRKDHHLDGVFLDFLLPEFQRLREYSLLLHCLPGYSQNANESLNSLVWNRLLNSGTKGLMLWK